jgi:hypothetical protein
MRNTVRIALTTVVVGILLGSFAPASSAMIVGPDPAGTGGGASTGDTGGTGIWTVIAIVLVAVAIGAVGTMLAQRTSRSGARTMVSR